MSYPASAYPPTPVGLIWRKASPAAPLLHRSRGLKPNPRPKSLRYLGGAASRTRFRINIGGLGMDAAFDIAGEAALAAAPAVMPIVQARGLVKRFGRVVALDHADLS